MAGKEKPIIILAIIVLSLILGFKHSYAVANPTGSSTAIPSVVESSYTVPITVDGTSNTSVPYVYQALLETKDDKIFLLNSIINWLFAGAAVLIALLGLYWNSLFRKLDNGLDILKEKEEKIDDIIRSKDFTEKFRSYQENLCKIEDKINEIEAYIEKLEQQKLTLIKLELIRSLRHYTHHLGESWVLYQRMTHEEQERYKTIRELTSDIEKCSIDEIEKYQNELILLFNKYWTPGDPYPV